MTYAMTIEDNNGDDLTTHGLSYEAVRDEYLAQRDDDPKGFKFIHITNEDTGETVDHKAEFGR